MFFFFDHGSEMLDDLDKAKLEKAAQEKYGEDVLDFPEVTDEFYREFERQEQELYDKLSSTKKSEEFENRNGYLVSKRLVRNGKFTSNCPYCHRYKIHFVLKDDFYMAKYGCCSYCFDRYIETKEARWETGWRPPLYEEDR